MFPYPNETSSPAQTHIYQMESLHHIVKPAVRRGGSQAVAAVSPDHEAPCSIRDEVGVVIATLPNASEAYRAARFAITPNGGYHFVIVEPAGQRPVTHQTFEEWAFAA